MNVYDFDQTIYHGDSTRDFYFFCLKRHKNIIKFLPAVLVHFLKFACGRITKTQFKEKFYVFLTALDDVDREVEIFWEMHEKNLKKWYLGQKKDSDLIISASPEFLLSPICKKLGIELIASRVDKFSGKTEGENCYGNEKLVRLKEKNRQFYIEEFYSDSYSDSPLALLAEKAFLVDGDRLLPWDQEKSMRH